MTIIVALADKKYTWLGHNDAATLGNTPMTNLNPWVRFGSWALGLSGNSALQQTLESHVSELEACDNNPSSVIKAMKSIFRARRISGFDTAKTKHKLGIWCILINDNGSIWDIDQDLSFTKIPAGVLCAAGSGGRYAKGADHATIHISCLISAKTRVSLAVNSAIVNDVTCPGSAVITQLIVKR